MRAKGFRNKIGFYILLVVLSFTITSLNVSAKTVVKVGEEATVFVDEELEFQGIGEGEYFWDFDESVDKNNDNDFTNDAEATGKTVTHKFKKTGTYIVTLTVQLGNTSKTYNSKITVEEETESEDLWLIGMGFIIAGVIMFLIEASQPGFFIGIPATICIVLGLIAIAFPQYFFSPISPIAALIFGVLTTVGIIYFYKFVAPPEKPTTSVGEALIGRNGIVMVDTIPTSDTKGKVKIGSQIWSATSKIRIKKGTRVVIVDYEGVHLIVEKDKNNK
jgi:membrane protein implicated in regulation of membrane protease activity